MRHLTAIAIALLVLSGCPTDPVDDDDAGPPVDDDDTIDDDDSTDDDDTSPVDADGDGFGDDVDCDDDDPAVHPDAEELCDGLDNDCDGLIDDDPVDPETFWADFDGDGFGNPAGAIVACEAPPGFVDNDEDCDDDDSSIHPGAPETDCADPVDYDCDGLVGYEDSDGDGFAACEECDDSDPDVHPGAVELCNEVDDDCDGAVDDDAVGGPPWYGDGDGDGWGDWGVVLVACEQPAGHVAQAGDCDDGAAQVFPGAPEVCDGVDQDCDGQIDEDAMDAATWFADLDGDGHGNAVLSAVECDPPAGYVASSDDCDDLDPASFPGAPELCGDGVDQDCDGSPLCDGGTVDADGDDWSSIDSGGDDCDDADPLVYPDAPELCDAVDQDCDGLLICDGGTVDADGDGYSADGLDCDDGDATVHPGAPDLCDGLDNDCDGGPADIGYPDLDADGQADCVDPDDDGDGTDDDPDVCPDVFDPDQTDTDGDGDGDACDDDDDGDGWSDTLDNCPLDTNSGQEDLDGDGDGDACDPDNDGDGWVDVVDVCPDLYDPDQDDLDGDGDGDLCDDDADGDGADWTTDCDDFDDASYPGAPELCDGVDNDCMGDGDLEAGLPVCLYGAGIDGDVTIADGNLSTDVLGSARVGAPDGVATLVVAEPTSADLTVESSFGFAAGDLALLINLQGGPGDVDDVGEHEVVAVVDVPDAYTVSLTATPTRSYSGADFAAQAVLLQRLPQWGDVTITGTLEADPWDGSQGGVLAFLVAGELYVAGQITMSERGYRGGDGATINGPGAWTVDGEGRAGPGVAGDPDPNDSGGGGSYGHGGLHNGNSGGGAHATRDPGPFGFQSGAISGVSGDVVGDADLSQVMMGGAGGGCIAQTEPVQAGGYGGGIVFVRAATFDLDGQVRSDGEDGFVCPGGDPSNNAGGAGGTVWLVADTLTAPVDSITAEGGTATSNSNNGQGAWGGEGRIRLEYEELNSAPFPDASQEEAVASPDPGATSLPGE